MDHEFKNNAFSITPKDTPADRLEVEIGDSKEPSTFQPQFKLMRWDNEVNCSIRLKDFDNYTLSTEGEKIKLVTPSKEVHFYDLPIDENNPEGAYEFEVILNSKPLTNKIEFTLNTKELSFYKQPSMLEMVGRDGIVTATETEGFDSDGNIAMGVDGAHSVHSYTFYTKSQKINYVDGKLYRCGVVGTIYRPKIFDSMGNWVWGELDIDGVTQELTVTIPHKFLDSAVYPVIVDPTFGYTTAGTGYTSTLNNDARGTLVTGVASTVDSISIYGYSSHASGYIKGFLIASSDLNVITNGVSVGVDAPSTSSAAKDWTTMSFSTPPTVSATDYFMCGISGHNSFYFYDAVAGAGTNSLIYDASNSYNAPASLSGNTPSGTKHFAIYCTYTASASTAVKDIIGGSGIIPFSR